MSISKREIVTLARAGLYSEIKVVGKSMNPTLYENDKIKIITKENYEPGEVLAFSYKNDTLLVHRLLYIKKGIYYCKGDNSFRLEDVQKEQIIGAVNEVNGIELEKWNDAKIALSYAVNREFVRCKYNIFLVKKTNVYRKYIDEIREKVSENV